MTSRAPILALVLAAAAPAVSVVAWSEPALAQDDVATQMARERFQEGVKFYDQKQYEKARAAFLQAYALKKHPAVLLNLAQSELRSKHQAEAAKHFAQYLREAPGSDAERGEAQKGLTAAKAAVGEMNVTVDVEGAEVFVDGTSEGRSPLPGAVYLTPGSHTLEAKKDGNVATATVTSLAGQTGSVTLSFSGPSGATPVPTPVPGPGNTMGQNPGQNPMGPGGGPTGPATGPGGGAGGSVQFDSGDERQPFFEWAAENKLAWVGGGLTVLGLAGGIGFGLSAKSNYDNADSIKTQIVDKANQLNVNGPCTPPQFYQGVDFSGACTKYQDNVDSGDSQKTLSIVSFVVAGAAAGGTIVYYFVDSKKPKDSTQAQVFRAGLVPVASPHASSLNLVGSF